jgi:hypothetical protein
VGAGISPYAQSEELDRRKLDSLEKHQRRLLRERKKRQARVLDLLSAGWTREEACWDVNVTVNTLLKWQRDDPSFREAVVRHTREGTALLDGVDRTNAYTMPFHILRKMCLGRDTYGYQQIMVDIIENAPEGEVTMILLPPGVGKTMTIEDWLTLELAKDQTKRVMYISESDDLGERTLEVIKQRFENESGEFDKLQELFGKAYDPDQKRAWRQKEIRLLGADIGLRDFNMRTRGMGSQIYSIRADIILLDDIQTRKTLSRTSKYLKDLRGTILTRREGAIEGKVIYIGTRLEEGDLAGEMIERNLVLPENLFILPLINEDGLSNFEETIKTSSLPTLIRQMGEEFQAVYQQNPDGGGGKTFGDVVNNICDRSYTIDTWHKAHGEDEILGRVVTIDPALTGGNAIVAMGYSLTDIYIYDIDIAFETNKISYSVDKIEEFVLAYQADTVIIEDKAYQKGLFTLEAMEDLAATYGFKLEKHTTGSEKKDPVWGVASMERPMASGRIHIPWGDEYSRKKFKEVWRQFNHWRADLPTKAVVQDAVMAIWFGYVWILKKRRSVMQRRNNEKRMKQSQQMHRRRGIRFHTKLPGRR